MNKYINALDIKKSDIFYTPINDRVHAVRFVKLGCSNKDFFCHGEAQVAGCDDNLLIFPLTTNHNIFGNIEDCAKHSKPLVIVYTDLELFNLLTNNKDIDSSVIGKECYVEAKKDKYQEFSIRFYSYFWYETRVRETLCSWYYDIFDRKFSIQGRMEESPDGIYYATEEECRAKNKIKVVEFED